MRVLIIGGTLFIGKHLAAALQAAGHEISVLHRGDSSRLSPGIRSLQADRNDPDAVARALSGQRFEVVFDNVYDWQRGTTADQVAATARACDSDALERYVFMSSVGAFVPGLDLSDDAPLVPDDCPELYPRNKAMSERALFAMSGFPAVTLRPPFVYGPENPFNREQFFWDRLSRGLPLEIPEDGSRLMQFVYVKDIVWAALRILERPAAVGRAFNLGNAEAISQVDAVRAIARATHAEPEMIFKPRGQAEFAEYFDLPPITMRIDAARQVLGFEPTSFAAGLQETYDWWRSRRS